MNLELMHLEDSRISFMFDVAMNSETGTASDGCGGRFTAEELFYEDQSRYARQWFFDHRNCRLTEDQFDNPPKNTTWDDYVS